MRTKATLSAVLMLCTAALGQQSAPSNPPSIPTAPEKPLRVRAGENCYWSQYKGDGKWNKLAITPIQCSEALDIQAAPPEQHLVTKEYVDTLKDRLDDLSTQVAALIESSDLQLKIDLSDDERITALERRVKALEEKLEAGKVMRPTSSYPVCTKHFDHTGEEDGQSCTHVRTPEQSPNCQWFDDGGYQWREYCLGVDGKWSRTVTLKPAIAQEGKSK